LGSLLNFYLNFLKTISPENSMSNKKASKEDLLAMPPMAL